MPWIILFVAGILEVGWAVGLKYTEGLTRHVWASLGTGTAMIASMLLLGYAMRFLPVGTAYAVWTGIGGAGTVALGILLFGESASFMRLFFVGMIVAGILGLKISSQ